MSDPLFDNAGLVRRDDDLLEVVGSTAGPAGVASIELALDRVLSVDYLQQSVLIDYTLPAAAAATDLALREVLGDELAFEVIDAATDSDATQHRLTRVRSPRGAFGTFDSLDPDGYVGFVGRLITLAERTDDPSRTPVEQAAAALDLAANVRFVFDQPTLRAGLEASARRASSLLAECEDEMVALAAIDSAVRDTLLSRLSHAGLPDQQVARVRGRIEDMAAVHSELAAVPTGLAFIAPMEPRLLPGDPASGVWVVECGPPTDAEPRWVRVVGPDLTVVAAAPVLLHDGRFAAELVVPSHVPRTDAAITVTATPFASAPKGLDAIAQAVRAGRLAVDLAACAHPDRVRGQWERCADLWHAVGDDERAARALREAKRAGSPRRPRRESFNGPMLADLILAATA